MWSNDATPSHREVRVSGAWIVLSLFVACSGGEVEPRTVEQLQGTWQVEPSEEDRRKATLLELAFREPPPTEADLSHADLTPQETQLVQGLLQARQNDPSEPRLLAMKAKMEGIDGALLEITDQELRFSLGGTTMVRQYTVLSSDASTVRVSVVDSSGQREEDQFSFRSPDEVELTEPSGRSTMLRRKPGDG